MKRNPFVVEPFSLPIGMTEVSVVISQNQPNNSWDVTVVLTRAPDQALIHSSELDAQLVDDKGIALKLLEHASGTLVEAGGSLGTSANAQFQFEDSNIIPAHLLVTYQNQEVRFRVVSTDTSQSKKSVIAFLKIRQEINSCGEAIFPS